MSDGWGDGGAILPLQVKHPENQEGKHTHGLTEKRKGAGG